MKAAWVVIVFMSFVMVGCGNNPAGCLWVSSLNQDTGSNPVPTEQVKPIPTATPAQTVTQTVTPTVTPTVSISTYSSTAFHPDITKVVSCPALDEFSVVRGYVRYSYHGNPWIDDIELPAAVTVGGHDIDVLCLLDVVNKQVVFYFDQPDPDLNTFYCVTAEVSNQ